MSNMAERPNWFKGLVQGGKKEDSVANKPETKIVSVETTASVDDGQPTSPRDVIRPEEMVFSLQGGWEQEGSPSDKSSTEVSKESDLVRLYLDISSKPPANFAAVVRSERVQEAAKTLVSWSVDALYRYLSGNEVWKRPSFTQAVFEEIRARMLLGNMSPRE